jgi:NifB/MoaA-like Fe-S oxidoreductase
MIFDMAKKLEKLVPGLKVNVIEVINHFFGETITVSGLLTGKDIFEQISDRELGEEVLIPHNCLRHGEDVFLCGMTLPQLTDKLGVKVTPCGTDGFDFIDAILGVE